MFGLFNEDNFLHAALLRIWEIVIANLLFILCCIPIVTIGPAFSALYHCTLKMVKGTHVGTLKTFFRAFKQNFKQSLIVWLGIMVLGFVLFANYQFLTFQSGTVSQILMYLTAIVALFIGMIVLYIFPVIATFEGTLKMLLKNAFLFAFMKTFKSLFMVILWAFPFVMTYVDAQLQPLYVFCWFFFGFATIAYICSFMFYKMFKPYLPVEEEPDESKYYEEHSAYLS